MKAHELTLGLNALTPDPSAALFHMGRLIAFVEEDRLSGRKHEAVWPELAIAEVLRWASADISDIDAAFYGFSPRAGRVGVMRSSTGLLTPGPVRLQRRVARVVSQADSAKRLEVRLRDIRARLPHALVTGVEHHASHAAYAFDASPYDRAAVVVLDSVGEYIATSISDADRARNKIKRLKSWSNASSLPALYGAVTRHLGWRSNDEEGTVMALAAQGDAGRYRTLFDDAVSVADDGIRFDPRLLGLRVSRTVRYANRYPLLSAEFLSRSPVPRAPSAEVGEEHADFAAALQEKYESGVLALCRHAGRLSGHRSLVLSGGGALNCVAAGLVSRCGAFDGVFVPPAPGDSGTAIGAALEGGGLELAGHTRGFAWGVAAGDADRIHGFARLDEGRDALPEVVAELLARGALVGICRGRSEAGPRALGHRSILASPVGTDVVSDLNVRVKQRESFRPFAPIFRVEDREFLLPGGAADTRYMSFAVPLNETVPHRSSVVHTNGLARAQTVSADENAFMWRVLTHFMACTGVPFLINTSLNIKGKPLSGTTELAATAASAAELDYFVLNDSLFEAVDRGRRADETGRVR